jgi:hypothetical protein
LTPGTWISCEISGFFFKPNETSRLEHSLLEYGAYMNKWSGDGLEQTSYANVTRFGDKIGLEAIFQGFEWTNTTWRRCSQILDSNFT